MAQGHSIDDYLETIYFLAFPIGEYTPQAGGSLPLASRVAEMLGVSRASAGEMLKRLEAEGLIERGSRKEALLTANGRERAERVGHRDPERPAGRAGLASQERQAPPLGLGEALGAHDALKLIDHEKVRRCHLVTPSGGRLLAAGALRRPLLG
jgi:DNA-binding transcriptional MocR family regulator